MRHACSRYLAVKDEIEAGLPISSYSEAEVRIKSESAFRHVYWAYPTVPSPYYGARV